jgi:hypothetical protein
MITGDHSGYDPFVTALYPFQEPGQGVLPFPDNHIVCIRSHFVRTGSCMGSPNDGDTLSPCDLIAVMRLVERVETVAGYIRFREFYKA